MNVTHTPDTVAPPFGPYSHAVEVPADSRLVYISGEVGVRPDGVVPDGVEAQADACWRNIIAIMVGWLDELRTAPLGSRLTGTASSA